MPAPVAAEEGPTKSPATAAAEGAPAAAPSAESVVVPAVVAPVYRNEMPLFAALPAQVRQGDLAMLGGLHRRVGDAGPDRGAWVRAVYTDLDIRQAGAAAPHSRGQVSGLQAGADLLVGNYWRAGIYVGALDGGADVSGNARGTLGRVGHNDLQSHYLGGYATWRDASGWYVDTVLQAGSHHYTVRPDGSPAVTGKARSVSASVEVGKSFALLDGWSIEPQAQLIRQRTSFDDVSIVGARVHQDAEAGWIGRLGVRVKGDIPTAAGRLQPYARVNVYRASSGADVATFIGAAGSARIASASGYTSTEVAAGLSLALTPVTTVFGEVGRIFSTGGDARVKSSVQGTVGLRVSW